MTTDTYYKAVRPDGGSFHDPAFRWATEPGGVTEHGRPGRDVSGYLSVSTVPTDCTGMSWPCRLLLVEPVGELWQPHTDGGLPNKRAGHAFRTVRELPAHEAFGPQGVEVAALIDRATRLTAEEARALDAARGAARGAARDAARGAALDAALDADRGAAWDAAWGAAWDAALDAAWDAGALMLRDLIGTAYTQEHYDIITGPWRKTIGPIHPDDEEMR